jgi:hypothetical protein
MKKWWKSGLCATLVSVVYPGPSLAADELCTKLSAFEQAPLAELPSGGLQRRWIDFSWEPPGDLPPDEIQLGATLRCVGSDSVATQLCDYALHNSSFEFMALLPLRILACQGFASASRPLPHRWVEELSWDTPNGLIEELQIDQLFRPDATPSMRLTILPFPENVEAKKPPPFFAVLAAKPGSDDKE